MRGWWCSLESFLFVFFVRGGDREGEREARVEPFFLFPLSLSLSLSQKLALSVAEKNKRKKRLPPRPPRPVSESTPEATAIVGSLAPAGENSSAISESKTTGCRMMESGGIGEEEEEEEEARGVEAAAAPPAR